LQKLVYIYVYIFFSPLPPHPPLAQQPPVGQNLLLVLASQITLIRHTTLGDVAGRVISPTQRPLPYNTQHSQETDMHDSGGIRTHNPSKPATAGIGV